MEVTNQDTNNLSRSKEVMNIVILVKIKIILHLRNGDNLDVKIEAIFIQDKVSKDIFRTGNVSISGQENFI